MQSQDGARRPELVGGGCVWLNLVALLFCVDALDAFYVSFIVTPLASNASEILASLSFASKKKTRNLSMSYVEFTLITNCLFLCFYRYLQGSLLFLELPLSTTLFASGNAMFRFSFFI